MQNKQTKNHTFIVNKIQKKKSKLKKKPQVINNCKIVFSQSMSIYVSKTNSIYIKQIETEIA